MSDDTSNKGLEKQEAVGLLDSVQSMLQQLGSYKFPQEDPALTDILNTHLQAALLQIQGMRLVIEIDLQVNEHLAMLREVGRNAVETNSQALVGSLANLYDVWSRLFWNMSQATKNPVFYAFHIALLLEFKEMHDAAGILTPAANKMDA